MTVFRKLRALGYRTSFSHRGKYYTLADIPQFDEQGLWSYRSVWFSQDGSLLETTERFVQEASAGWTASEMRGLLQVEVREISTKDLTISNGMRYMVIGPIVENDADVHGIITFLKSTRGLNGDLLTGEGS